MGTQHRKVIKRSRRKEYLKRKKALEKAGAAVNAKGNNGETPLYAAVRTHQPEIAELLLANKADVNAKDKEGNTPLRKAVAGKHEDMAELLRQHGGHE